MNGVWPESPGHKTEHFTDLETQYPHFLSGAKRHSVLDDLEVLLTIDVSYDKHVSAQRNN